VYALRFAKLDERMVNDGGEETTRLKMLMTFLFKRSDFDVAKARVVAEMAAIGVSGPRVSLPREGTFTHGDVLEQKRRGVVAEIFATNVETAGMGVLTITHLRRLQQARVKRVVEGSVCVLARVRPQVPIRIGRDRSYRNWTRRLRSCVECTVPCVRKMDGICLDIGASLNVVLL
jgi:hypothetical protein